MKPVNYQSFFISPYYEYWGNVEKKRIYSKFIGSWKDPDIVPTFLADTNKLVEMMPLGIETSIADVSLIGVSHHEKCKEAHRELHRLANVHLKNLVLLIAQSHNHGDIFYVMPLHEQTRLRVSAQFYNLKAAEEYLDSWQQAQDKKTSVTPLQS